METIDITPTWSDTGSIVYRLAISGETKAIRAMHRDIVRAFAMADALQAITAAGLTEAQIDLVGDTLARELNKAGV